MFITSDFIYSNTEVKTPNLYSQMLDESDTSFTNVVSLVQMNGKQLSNSAVDRQNILNNPYAVSAIQEQIGIKGILIDGEFKFTIRQLAEFYEVDTRTINRYMANYAEELRTNGYEMLTGEKLDEAKAQLGGGEFNVPNVGRLGVVNFRGLINLGMLLAESEKARVLRSLILDLVIKTVVDKSGGDTVHINQRDEAYLIASFKGKGYRQVFIDALKDCVEMGNSKYAIYTNKIYKSIFHEHAAEYRNILSLTKKENVRDTMYSEILTTISMYETGLGNKIRNKSEGLGRKLTTFEIDDIFREFETDPTWEPQIEMARMKMASRDYGFRSVLHPELVDYINPLDTEEFERFLGEKSADLATQIEQYQDVFKRLKDK